MESAGCTITLFSVPTDSVDRTLVFLQKTLFLQNPAVPGGVFPQGACLV